MHLNALFILNVMRLPLNLAIAGELLIAVLAKSTFFPIISGFSMEKAVFR